MNKRVANISRIVLTAMLCLCLLAIAGCKKDTTERDPFYEKWKEMAEQSKGHSPSPPQRVAPSDLVAKDIELEPERELPSVMIGGLDMRNANVVAVLRALGKIANQSIMVSPGVAGTINVNVENLPWDQVFKGLTRTHGLAWEWEGQILRVMTAEDMEKNLKLDQIRYRKPLVTTAIKINYADAEQLREDMEKLLAKDAEGNPRGSVEVVEHTNSLIIHSVKEDVVRFAELVDKLDRPSAQVHFKAYIVETSSDTARDLGIQWGGGYASSNQSGAWSAGGGADNRDVDTGIANPTLNNTRPGATGSAYAMNFPGNIPNDDGIGAQLGLAYVTASGNVLEVQLRALEEDSKLNILSNPSLTTLDNQTAYTENGEEVPFVTIDEAGNYEVEWKDATLRLEITPHVIDGVNLRMDINVKKDEVDFTRTVQGNPLIIKKATETSLISRSGETVVISGLKRTRNTSGGAGLPYLKDVPGLGHLFGSTSKGEELEEVLIFITPTILAEWIPGEVQKTLEEVETDINDDIAKELEEKDSDN
ncbi:type IV pilus secretin PilQ [Desulfovibrio ferrophilus]|uniref:Type II and III secretion system protein n=1 Tax=Desulfovibrio ferrophilus TaxID=241368 RepID=A0A2Z6AZ48_9BACT|nr:type IV pilus secretin PilQ [Desulfovibrio ferrophilus]BBD08519.1 type II and III secretion system protein [Desulfovibrio ferrophilus]